MLGKMLENVRYNSPLIQNITNHITVNDCANIILACGAQPIMTDDIKEAADINNISSGLNINIGTLNTSVDAMFEAGKNANKISRPVLFDPVGAGASAYRTEITNKLLSEVKFSVIRGNVSEIKTLIHGKGSTKGVDADISDIITDENLDANIHAIKALAKTYDTVIVATGAIDIVADKNRAYVIRNGHEMLTRVTGTGCMLSAMTTAFISANPDNILIATVASVCTMGLSGEIAFTRMTKQDGNSSYRNHVIDAVFNMSSETLENGAKYEIR